MLFGSDGLLFGTCSLKVHCDNIEMVHFGNMESTFGSMRIQKRLFLKYPPYISFDNTVAYQIVAIIQKLHPLYLYDDCHF
jgi:hypothetical protein